MQAVTLNQIHEDIVSIRVELGQIKAILEEDFELVDELQQEIGRSRQRSSPEFISHREMKEEFG